MFLAVLGVLRSEDTLLLQEARETTMVEKVPIEIDVDVDTYREIVEVPIEKIVEVPYPVEKLIEV